MAAAEHGEAPPAHGDGGAAAGLRASASLQRDTSRVYIEGLACATCTDTNSKPARGFLFSAVVHCAACTA